MSAAVIILPLKTLGPNGSHGHWRVLAARRKRERYAARMTCPMLPLPVVITLTRVSAGTLDDDNLRGALKGVRDGCADKFGIPDNDPRIRWEYAQEKGARGTYGVRIEVTEISDIAYQFLSLKA
ncbi:MAG: hypothetical protein ABIR55_08870 [Burkholderiaceae bacterium]